ncbi:MAG TPA: ABC transporter ATP-binding protein [Candidatus Saccharimonadales bacterium]|nr:ABC transporter ATP-binding protein [Candidatus Saccharimonadales bacterium]
MLEVKGLTRTFQTSDIAVQALQDISFAVPDGQFVSIIGKSGSGKTTLMSLLGALDKPTSGSIVVDDKDITTLSDHELVRYRSRKIGFVFQAYNLVPNLTALENVTLPMEAAYVPKHERVARARQLLNQVGLQADKQKRKPGRLSGGEQQRVAIARALANKPAFILADEPTGNLDSQTGQMIFDLLKEVSQTEHTTIIIVTHDLALAQRTQAMFELRDGALSERKK